VQALFTNSSTAVTWPTCNTWHTIFIVKGTHTHFNFCVATRTGLALPYSRKPHCFYESRAWSIRCESYHIAVPIGLKFECHSFSSVEAVQHGFVVVSQNDPPLHGLCLYVNGKTRLIVCATRRTRAVAWGRWKLDTLEASAGWTKQQREKKDSPVSLAAEVAVQIGYIPFAPSTPWERRG
jgi:hypothetical protein